MKLVFYVAAAAAAALWGVSVYNRLVRFSSRRDEGWSGISVQLKRRHDVVPNLVAVTKGLSGHEKELLTSVTRARTAQGSGSLNEIAGAENALTAALGRFIAVAEAYPEIKADSAFNNLMGELSRLEDDIQLARRYYNGVVREYNVAVRSFPSSLIASLAGFRQAAFFELSAPDEAAPPKISF